MTDAQGERLQKFLAEVGLGSRREIEAWIRAGRLSVNGRIAELGVRVTPRDEIRLDGRPVRQRLPRRFAAYLCNRSPGEDLREPSDVPAQEATTDEKTARERRLSMVARLPRRTGRRFLSVSPMPRIDGGLEILTSDGALALALQRGVRSHVMQFSVRVKGLLGPDQLGGVQTGEIDRPPPLEVLELDVQANEGEEPEVRATNRWYRISARGASGKDIRQLFERQGVTVSRVLRTAFGPIALDRAVARGQFRALTDAELASLGVSTPRTAIAPSVREPRPARSRPGFKRAARRTFGPSRRDSRGPTTRGRGR
jgi:23S rRNA pseudouridine2605 synthase